MMPGPEQKRLAVGGWRLTGGVRRVAHTQMTATFEGCHRHGHGSGPTRLLDQLVINHSINQQVMCIENFFKCP